MDTSRIQTSETISAPQRAFLRGGVLPAISALGVATAIFIGTLAGTGSASATAETVVQTVPAAESTVADGSVQTGKTRGGNISTLAAGTIRTSSAVPTQMQVTQVSGVEGRHNSVPAPASVAVANESVSASLAFSARKSFSFANWAGESETSRTTADMLITMFGANSVCVNGTDESCELRAGARALVDQFNEQLVNGRCEGMVAMAGFSIESGRDLSELSVDQAGAEIAYWSFTQVAPRVVARAEETMRMQPSRIVDSLINNIRKGHTVTLMISVDGFSHSVLPVSVTRANGIAHIGVYDPNFPGETHTLTVDVNNESWSYDSALNSRGEPTSVSVKGAGALGFVENSLRSGLHRARFAN